MKKQYETAEMNIDWLDVVDAIFTSNVTTENDSQNNIQKEVDGEF